MTTWLIVECVQPAIREKITQRGYAPRRPALSTITVRARQHTTHSIGADLTDPDWLDHVLTSQPAVVVADGLPFLSQHDFASLLNRLISHFPGGGLALNLYTSYAIWTPKHFPSVAAIAGDMVNPGFNDPHQPERWADGLKLIERFS